MARRLVSFLASALFAVALPAQATPPAPTPPPQGMARALDPTTVQALERLAVLLQEKRADLERLRPSLDAAALRDKQKELQDLGWQFAGLASGERVMEFEAPSEKRFDLQQEIEQLVRPLLQSLKDATATPRQISELESRIAAAQARQGLAESAQRAVERTRDQLAAGSAGRAEAEREIAQRWRPAVQSLRDEVLVLQANKQRLEEGRRTLFETLTASLQEFVQNRGMSVLLCIGVFLGVLFALRWLVDRLLRGGRDRGFAARLVGVVLRVLVVLLAVIATMVVPYARGDWFLLAIGIVFLLGAGWVVMRMAPQFFEQIRLVLNVGGVREGERLLVDGLPFRVEALRFYTRLVNPDLQGGVLRVPLQFLVGRRSRLCGPDEPWFPTRVGDHVLLADGTCGPVTTQSPEVVVVEHWGSPRSFPTAKFLELSPRNLSRGFTVDSTLDLARANAPTVTTTVRETLQQEVAAALATVVPAHQLRRVRVEFAAVTANGFDLLALADCDGAAAPCYFELRRTMQRALVDACRRHGYTLPPPTVLTAPV